MFQKNSLMPGIRLTNLILALGSAGLIGVGLYFQYQLGLTPCALCITQRIFIIAVGVTAAVAALLGVRYGWRRVLAGLGMLLAIIGGGFSSRQLWLQSLPEDLVPACGPSLGYILDAFPLKDALAVLLRGDGNCAEVVWTFLGVSIPGWTLVAFIGLALINLWQILRKA
ncbi:disulfide bond formation protein B [Halioxenophilus sp. WMMB6]|uniref:disulfide bond formation protein B n=1 Tax=Halioxenophilus sp. WMMB6 TaxID=3073815 RepID=UPI00295EF89C|nr:disulfide bond formation protein B [Halioxenophilus sp. WMMB6]